MIGINPDFESVFKIHQTSGERRLCAAIVHRALLDFVFFPKGHPIRRDAYFFIVDDSTGKGSFRWAVAGAGVATVDEFRAFCFSDLTREEKIRRLHKGDPQVIKHRGKKRIYELALSEV